MSVCIIMTLLLSEITAVCKDFHSLFIHKALFSKIILRKGNVEINWEKTASQCDGYEIMYSQYPSFINNQVVDVNNKTQRNLHFKA